MRLHEGALRAGSIDRTELVGGSQQMRALRAAIGTAAPMEAPVLVQGETGAGKELVSRSLCGRSARARAPFIAVNCGAIPRSLVEVELFGCELGAYTGARRRDGLFQRADGGTLFLDEIGDLPREAQAVLLRVLETGELTALGGGRPRRVDVRLISATHRELGEQVGRGLFRADLYHRIAALIIRVPPLRDRVVDIPLLAPALLSTPVELTAAALDRLRSHRWPGNVRELRNVLVRAQALAGAAPNERLRVDAAHVRFDPPILTGPTERAGHPLHVVIAHHVQETWERHDRNVRAAARELQISPTTVYRHLAIAEARGS